MRRATIRSCFKVGERHVVALRVTEREGERPKKLENVRHQVINELKSERRRRGCRERGRGKGAGRGDRGRGAGAGSSIFEPAVIGEIFVLPRPSDDAPRTASAVLADGDFPA